MSEQRNDLYDSRQRGSRFNRGNVGIIIFIALIIFLLVRSGFFTAEYWTSAGEKFFVNFVKDRHYMMIVKGLWATLKMTIIASLLGVAIGLVLSLIRVAYRGGAKIGILNFLANLYITVIRGTPVMVQILIWYFTIFGNVRNVDKLLVAAIAFGVNSGAYVAEIFRSGIESLDPGQMEAGRSLGLSYGKSLVKIVLPQAFKNTLPTLFNELIMLLKETSVAGYIGIDDLTRSGQNIQAITFDNTQPLLMVALVYLVMVLLLTWLMNKLEKRLRRSDRN